MGEGWGEGEIGAMPLSPTPLPQGARGFMGLTERHEGQTRYSSNPIFKLLAFVVITQAIAIHRNTSDQILFAQYLAKLPSSSLYFSDTPPPSAGAMICFSVLNRNTLATCMASLSDTML